MHPADHARLVHVGRPWSNPAQFDLVVSNRQYLLGASDNVIVNDLPLTDSPEQSLADERAVWGAKWAELAHPLTVVLVGGDSGPLVFSTGARARAGSSDQCARGANRRQRVVDHQRPHGDRAAPMRCSKRCMRPRSCTVVPSREDNPYRGLLACGDEFVVTADSMSMLAEACATGKPV